MVLDQITSGSKRKLSYMPEVGLEQDTMSGWRRWIAGHLVLRGEQLLMQPLDTSQPILAQVSETILYTHLCKPISPIGLQSLILTDYLHIDHTTLLQHSSAPNHQLSQTRTQSTSSSSISSKRNSYPRSIRFRRPKCTLLQMSLRIVLS